MTGEPLSPLTVGAKRESGRGGQAHPQEGLAKRALVGQVAGEAQCGRAESRRRAPCNEGVGWWPIGGRSVAGEYSPLLHACPNSKSRFFGSQPSPTLPVYISCPEPAPLPAQNWGHGGGDTAEPLRTVFHSNKSSLLCLEPLLRILIPSFINRYLTAVYKTCCKAEVRAALGAPALWPEQPLAWVPGHGLTAARPFAGGYQDLGEWLVLRLQVQQWTRTGHSAVKPGHQPRPATCL